MKAEGHGFSFNLHIDTFEFVNLLPGAPGRTDAPMQFVTNQTVSEFVKLYGADRLPVTVVDGKLAVSGRYPTNEEFTEWLALLKDVLGRQESCCGTGCGCQGGCC